MAADDPSVITLGAQFRQLDLTSRVGWWLDSTSRLGLEAVRRQEVFTPNPHDYLNFGITNATCWLRFSLENATANAQSLTLVTSGLDSAFVYIIAGDSVVHRQQQGTHIAPGQRAFLSALQVFTIDVPASQSRTILMRLRMSNYPLSIYPMQLLATPLVYRYLRRIELFRSIYIGGLVIIVLFAAYMALAFWKKLYLYYLLIAVSSLSMVSIYNDFHYLFLDDCPQFIRDKNAYGLLVTLLSVGYLLFARAFVSYGYRPGRRVLRLNQILLIVNGLLLFLVLFYQQNVSELRWVFSCVVIANSALTYFYVGSAIRNGYRPAWFFVLASTPVMGLSLWEALASWHHTPIQQMHTLYYSFTLFEMYALMLGLTKRFRTYEKERKEMQQEMFEKQMRVEEKIRQRIGLDLHDKVGGLLAALKINLSFLENKSSEPEGESYRRVFEILDNAATETRLISHSMLSNQLKERGLVSMLAEYYKDLEKPEFVFQTKGMQNRLETSTEMMLYGVVNEIITNVLNHADAQRVDVQFNRNKNDELTVVVEDDGRGFDLSAPGGPGRGLLNLTTRVREHLRGDLVIDSTPGRGTVVMVRIDLRR